MVGTAADAAVDGRRDQYTGHVPAVWVTDETPLQSMATTLKLDAVDLASEADVVVVDAATRHQTGVTVAREQRLRGVVRVAVVVE